MLKQLLRTMMTGELRTTQAELATAMDVPESLLSQMIAQLASQGYLALATTCTDGCEGCPVHMKCDQDHRLRIWTLTEKGVRAAAS